MSKARIAAAGGQNRKADEIEAGVQLDGRVRAPGAGRKRCADEQPGLLEALRELIEGNVMGDPMRPMLWTSKSSAKLMRMLRERGFEVSEQTVRRETQKLGYRLQTNKKTREGKRHPDRDGQFRYINEVAAQAIADGQPVISIDAKKRENLGDFKARGRELAPTGEPVEVSTHDFKDKELGHAVPYGVYDVGANEGWVSVGVDGNTSSFAVNAIIKWWEKLGQARYPNATRLTITADAGGSNGPRVRLWRYELQRLADTTGLDIVVLHYPPGTSKWNRIEHRMFSFISTNWRGKPLYTRQIIINLIAGTTTTTGLKVYSELDEGEYPTGIKVTDEQLATVNINRHEFHGDWNYTVSPA